MTPLDRRRNLYTELSSQLTVMDRREMIRLVKSIPYPSAGWGSNGVIQIGDRSVFVKRIPVTELEYENAYSTRNLFGLPTYYNYGLGSFGLGAYREIIAYIKTTNWVLDGSCPFFPMMFHHRILPWPGDRPRLDPEKHADYVRYWNNNRRIGAYRESRASASHQAVLFIEYFPHVLSRWLRRDLRRLERTVPRVLDILSFLRSNGVIHFDAHHWNIVTEGRHPYLTDFGVVSDLSYQLTRPERAFFHRNTYYGPGEFLSVAVGYTHHVFKNLPPLEREGVAKVCGVVGAEPQEELIRAISENVEEIVSRGLMRLPRAYVDFVVRYREIGHLHRDWESGMKRGSRKNIRYENERVQSIVDAASR